MVLKKYSRGSLACITSLIIGMMALMNMSCSEKKDQDQVVLAKVGKKTITVQDFRYNYEFGLPHLKKGTNSKETYLDFMIREELLACEGYHLGLNRSERIRKLENELMEELLVETLFRKEVDDKITITPEEIKEAIAKSNVKWKLRYWAEPTMDEATRVGLAMREQGYGTVVDDLLRNNPEVKIKPEDFTTDYLNYLDVSPELLDAIKDLPIGNISDPVEMNGAFFIFQIIDIRREPMTEPEFNEKAKSYEKILLSRKADEETKRFVSAIMTPKNVVTKGDAFRKLSNALYEWHRKGRKPTEDFIQAVRSAQEEESALFQLKIELNQPLVTFQNGRWTMNDFLERFQTNSIKLDDFGTIADYRKALNQEIALKIRNYFLIDKARKMKLHKEPLIKKEMQLWVDKWVYQEFRDSCLKDLQIDDEEAGKYFMKYKDHYKTKWGDEPMYGQHAAESKRDAYLQSARALLKMKADSLKTIYPVFIDQSVLDTITVIDSRKSKGISVQVFKRGSNRLAHPIVDSVWNF